MIASVKATRQAMLLQMAGGLTTVAE